VAETKNEKFCRIANSRLSQVLYTFGLIDNLIGPNYKRSKQHEKEIVYAILNEIDKLESLFFADDSPTKSDEFDLMTEVERIKREEGIE
jgi:hypothetical protein